MPQHEAILPLQGMETDTALQIALVVFQQLQWSTLLATDTTLIGNTPRNWKTYGQQIVVDIANDELTIRSEMVNGEAVDIGKKNSKNVQAFITAWEQSSLQPTTATSQQQALADLRQQTAEKIEQEVKEAAEVDAVMKFSNNNLYATYTIIALNLLVFVLMALNGAGLFDSNNLVHIAWGSNYSQFTLSGDWWRLITNLFIHFGIIHLAMNMYSLYMVGIYLERMLGKARYVSAYLATGVLGSIASLWWHSDGVNSAGASGAVFGLYGLFLALLTTNLIPKQVRQSLLGSIGIFVAYNLIYGIKGGIDNAAHIGGLLSGIVIGYLYAFSIKKEKEGARPMLWMAGLVALITCGITYAYLQQNKVSDEARKMMTEQIDNEHYKGYTDFNNALGEFDELQKQVFALLEDEHITNPDKKQKVTDSILPIWSRAAQTLEATRKLDISDRDRSKANKLLHYVDIRKQQMRTIVDMIEAGQQPNLLTRHNMLRDSAIKVFEDAVSQ